MVRPPRQLPVVAESEKATGLKTDSDVWGALLMLVGGPVSRALTTVEHIEFLASVRNGGFKMILDLWNGFGWWIAAVVGLVWLLNRHSKRNSPHPVGPTWGFVIAASLMSSVFAAIITVQTSGAFPRVIVGTGYQTDFGPQGTRVHGCGAALDGAAIMSFKKGYKVALLCAPNDPSVDQTTDKRITVSQLLEIEPAQISAVAESSPSGDFAVQFQSINLALYPILVPRGVEWKQITTIGILLQLGGKVLDPRYYE